MTNKYNMITIWTMGQNGGVQTQRVLLGQFEV